MPHSTAATSQKQAPADVTPELRAFLNHLWRTPTGGPSWAYWWSMVSGDQGGGVSTWFDAQGEWPPLPHRRLEIYFGVNPSAYIPTTNKEGEPRKPADVRSRKETIAALNTIYDEFDTKDGATLAIVESLEPAPSVVVASGGGWHCYWLLVDPWDITAPTERQRAIELQREWVEHHIEQGADKGAKDIARILRVPGTVNHKPERNGAIVEFVRCDMSRLYTPEELAAWLPPREPKTPKEPKQPYLNGNGNGHHGDITQWDEVQAAVRALSSRRAMNHDDWLKVGMAIHSIDSGDTGWALFDEFSSRCPEKNKEHRQRKRWDSFTPGGGITVDTLFKYAHEDSPGWQKELTRTAWSRTVTAPEPWEGIGADSYVEVWGDNVAEMPTHFADYVDSIIPTTRYEGDYSPMEGSVAQEPPPEPTPGNPFATWQFKSIAAYAATPPPEVAWVVDGLLPANSVSIWHGLPGSLKTQLLLDMAGCVATGEDWLPKREGTDEGFTFKTTKTKVLWANFDMAEPDMHARAAALHRMRPHTVDGDLQVVSLPNPWLDLSKAIATEALAELVIAQGFGLVFIDNLSNAKGGAMMIDETVNALMLNVRRLSAAANCSVVLVHHETKTGAGKTAQERMFGGVGLAAAIELGMSIQREPNGDRVTLTASKQRNYLATTTFSAEHAYQPMANGQLDSFRFFAASGASPIKQEEKSPLQAAVLRALLATPLRSITVADVAARLGGEYKENSVRNALAKMVDAGVIKRRTEGNTSLYSPVQPNQPEQGGILER